MGMLFFAYQIMGYSFSEPDLKTDIYMDSHSWITHNWITHTGLHILRHIYIHMRI